MATAAATATTPPLARSLLVCYASQTGNAEWIARHLRDGAERRGARSARCLALDELAAEPAAAGVDADAAVLVFVASTTGDGDPPDNATKFWRWLRRAKKPELDTAFRGRKYAILGLGDTNYSNFCQHPKRLDRKLIDLGASAFMPKGLADDATGLEEVVDPWVEQLWEALPTVLDLDPSAAAAFLASGASSFMAAKASKPASAAAPDSTVPKATAGTTSVNANGSAVATASAATAQPAAASITGTTPTVASSVDSGAVDDLDAALARLAIPPQHAAAPIALTVLPAATAADPATAVPPLPLPPTLPFALVATGERRPFRQSRDWPPCAPHQASAGDAAGAFAYTAARPFAAQVVATRRLTGARAVSRVHEITLDVSGMGWAARAGDVLSVVAPNPDELVLPLLRRLGLDADAVVDVAPAPGSAAAAAAVRPLPVACTAYEVLRYLVDLRPPPRAPLLQLLAARCAAADSDDARRLQALATGAAPGTLRALRSERPSLADWLATFPSVSGVTLAELVEVLPRLQPRQFSVARIDHDGPVGGAVRRVSLGFAVVEYETPGGRRVVGHATPWLEALCESAVAAATNGGGRVLPVVPVFPKPESPFRPPELLALAAAGEDDAAATTAAAAAAAAAPLVMIAAGTGLTPFVSFLEARAAASATAVGGAGGAGVSAKRARVESGEETVVAAAVANEVAHGPALLYHGRRFLAGADGDGDRIYGRDLDTWRASGVLARLCEAVSRDAVPPHAAVEATSGGGPDLVVHGYVQEALRADGQRLWALAQDSGAYFYVCGSTALARDVHDALVGIATTEGGLAAVEARAFWTRLSRERRYCRD
ncbi:hypothetical protein HK405_008901, partial [Cladochytrium tenue]